MELVGSILGTVAGLGSLICFILVIIKMFQSGSTGLAIACLLLLLCCGIGYLIAFVYGWIKSGDWKIRNVMLIWTVCIVLSMIGNAMNPSAFNQLQDFQKIQGK